MSMDELAKPWIVVRNGQIIGAYDDRRCAYAVAKEAGASVHWCDGMHDGKAHLALMVDYDPDEDVLYQPEIVIQRLTSDTPAEAIHDMIANALGEE
jgi:hypothetical protein